MNGQVDVRPMMYMALTYDHRLIDGRKAVTFLVWLKELIVDPRRMLSRFRGAGLRTMYPTSSLRFVFHTDLWGPYFAMFLWLLPATWALYRVALEVTKRACPDVKKKDAFALYFVNLVLSTSASVCFIQNLAPVYFGSASIFLYANEFFAGINIVVCLYAAEIMIRNEMPVSLLVHHVSCLIVALWGVLMRNEPQMKQLVVMLLFATLEQPCQIGMICYRVGSPAVRKAGLAFAFVAFAITRAANIAMVFWLATQEWRLYETSFQVVFTLWVMLIIWAQYMTLVIYWSLLKRVRNPKTRSSAGIAKDTDEWVVSDGNSVPIPVEQMVQLSTGEPSPEDPPHAESRKKNTTRKSFQSFATFGSAGAALLACVLMIVFIPSKVSYTPYHLDGSNNHPTYPASGQANISFASLQDPIHPANLPSTKDVCSRVLNRTLFPPSFDPQSRSLFDVSFGQFVSHDLTLTSTNKSALPIFVGATPEETAWPWIDNNEQTAWLDLSNLYGTTPEALQFVRNASDPCKLRVDPSGNLLFENGQVVTGDQRATESPFLLGWHTLFTKEHNYECNLLATVFPELTGDALFFKAREATILMYQRIAFSDYFTGYTAAGGLRYGLTDRNVDYLVNEKQVTINNEFDILYRLHTMIPDSIKIIASNGSLVGTYSIDQVFYNTTLSNKYGLDAMLRGAMSTVSNQYGRGYPAAMTTDRFNLCQIDLLRSRERGLVTYNTARRGYSLPPVTEWSQVTSIPVIQESLKELYASVDEVEMMVGSFLDPLAKYNSFGVIGLQVMMEQVLLVGRSDRWGILNFDVAPRDLAWQNQLVQSTYGRSLYDVIKQHLGVTCVATDVLRVGEGRLVCD
ncbi:hypothetical protein HDU98_004262 [Podochytrium sp. JEL0797]|nr:hypothetical protein HDU98_004262 [Podochytrium sp. JEL0797]